MTEHRGVRWRVLARQQIAPGRDPNATLGLVWEQFHEDMRARRIRTYRVGIGQNMRPFASRVDVEDLARARAAS